jgi:hypothetical protein
VCYLLLGWWYLILAAKTQTCLGKPRKERDKHMSFKPLKTSVALASAATLAAFGLVAVPAQAAVGDVTIAPLTGSGTTVFQTDDFSLETTVSSLILEAQLSYLIDNPDQHTLHIDIGGTSADVFGVKADGTVLGSTSDGELGNATVTGDGLIVDFVEMDIVSLLVVNLSDTSKAHQLDIKLVSDNPTNAADGAGTNLTWAQGTADVAVTVTAWVETTAAAGTSGSLADAADYATVDAAYSDSITITFTDPEAVSPITQVERFHNLSAANVDAGSITGLLFVDRVVVDATATAPEADTGAADSDGGAFAADLTAFDTILVIDSGTATETGIYEAGNNGTMLLDNLANKTIVDLNTGDVYFGTADAATKISGANYSLAAADLGSFTRIWMVDDPDITSPSTDSRAQISDDTTGLSTGDIVLVVDSADGTGTAVYEVKASTASPVVEKTQADLLAGLTFDVFNNTGDSSVGGSLKFSNPSINLDQTDFAKWNLELESSSDDDVVQADFAGMANEFIRSGFSSYDAAGELTFTVEATDGFLNKSATYNLSVAHDGATGTEYKSPGFQVVASPSAAANAIAASVTDAVNVNIKDVSSNAYPTDVRNGTAAVKFDAQVYTSAGVETETSNIPVIAVVTAGATLPAGATLTVSGTNDRVTSSSASVITSGLTNSDGQYSVTVTSSDTSAAGSRYDVQFYVLDSTSDLWLTAHDDAGNALYQVDYTAAAIAATDGFGTATTVASGSTVSLTFDLEDQFGEPLSETSTGKPYSVELSAPNTDNLELYGQIVDGSVVLTFENYLAEGSSDVLTAKLYTGTSTSPSASDFVSGQTDNITLYNTNAAVGINVTEEITAVDINYTDFFEGKPGSGDTVPTATKATITGTVVDANGAGVPGAPVTFAAEGFAFEIDGTYAIDTMSTIADASGGFSVDFWTTVLTGADGVDVTVTSGDLTADTNVVTGLPATLDGGNLVFSWSVPAVTVMNTTYAVVATLTDVWGNPIAGQDIDFAGLAAAEFNAGTTAERTTAANGTAIAYLRSIKDVDGLAAISATIDATDEPTGVTTFNNDATSSLKDVATTSWDESLWNPSVDAEITFLKSAADAPASAQKVNAGSFKGYVALYAKGYEGQRMSAKVGNDWVIVAAIPAATNDLFRAVEFVGAGVEISVRIYIDRVLVETIPLLTK